MQTLKRHIYRPTVFLSVFLFALLPSLLLAGCGKTGKLDEGDCKCTVSFTDIPKVVSMLEENVQNNLSINVTLKNIVTEKQYDIALNQKNDFQKEISLNPGVYKVYGVYAENTLYNNISVSADVESVQLDRETSSEIHIYVDNEEEFTQHWMSVQPMPEMLLAEKFDGLIQINRQIVDLRSGDSSHLISQLNLNLGEATPVRAYDRITLTDSDMGVQITLINTSDQTADWQSCRLLEMYVYKNNVVFPQGVTLGMAPSKICNETTGLYGAPDAFTGSLLYGWGFDDTQAIYRDEITGDSITITLAGGTIVTGIRYALAQY